MDPLAAQAKAFQGFVHLYAGRWDLAAEPLRRAHEREPDNPLYRVFYGLLEAYRRPSWEMVRRNSDVSSLSAPSLSPRRAHLRIRPNRTMVLLGSASRARSRTARAESRRLWGHFVAAPLAYVGADDEALDVLEQAVTVGFINYPMMAEHDPFLAKLRGNKRFEKLLARVKREWEAFEV